MRVEPYNMVKARTVGGRCTDSIVSVLISTVNSQESGNAIPCMATKLLSQDPPLEEASNDEFVKNCCAVVYSGSY